MTLSRRHFIAGTSSLTLLGSPLFNARAAKLEKAKSCDHYVTWRHGRAYGCACA